MVRWLHPPDGKLALASGAISYSTATTTSTLESPARQNRQPAKSGKAGLLMKDA